MLQSIEKYTTKADLKILGNVFSVVEGCVNDKLLAPVSKGTFQFALGSGTFKDSRDVGETLVINGKSYVSVVKNGAVQTTSQPALKSPFLVGIDGEQMASELLHYNGSAATPAATITLEELYTDLASQLNVGFAIVGHALCDELDSTYLVKTPTYGENIYTNEKEYWAKNPKEQRVSISFFGVVIPNSLKESYPAELSQKLFYQNVHHSRAISHFSHTHGAILKAHALDEIKNFHGFFNSLNNHEVRGIRHILPQTTIHEGYFAIYPISTFVQG